MTMAFYRVYSISHGHTMAAHVLECENDVAALEKARELLSASSHQLLVIWQDDRKVGLIERTSSQFNRRA